MTLYRIMGAKYDKHNSWPQTRMRWSRREEPNEKSAKKKKRCSRWTESVFLCGHANATTHASFFFPVLFAKTRVALSAGKVEGKKPNTWRFVWSVSNKAVTEYKVLFFYYYSQHPFCHLQSLSSFLVHLIIKRFFFSVVCIFRNVLSRRTCCGWGRDASRFWLNVTSNASGWWSSINNNKGKCSLCVRFF